MVIGIEDIPIFRVNRHTSISVVRRINDSRRPPRDIVPIIINPGRIPGVTVGTGRSNIDFIIDDVTAETVDAREFRLLLFSSLID